MLSSKRSAEQVTGQQPACWRARPPDTPTCLFAPSGRRLLALCLLCTNTWHTSDTAIVPDSSSGHKRHTNPRPTPRPSGRMRLATRELRSAGGGVKIGMACISLSSLVIVSAKKHSLQQPLPHLRARSCSARCPSIHFRCAVLRWLRC